MNVKKNIGGVINVINVKVLATVVCCMLATQSVGQIHNVKQDSTGDFIHIQDAIDFADDGDTVLIWPGIYYENLVYHNKSLTIGSLNLTTGDPSYISQTIVDGRDSTSCIQIHNAGNDNLIHGLVLKNGNASGSHIFGGGIGIYGSRSEVANCLIKNNKAEIGGGGIYVTSGGQLYLSGTTICFNHAKYYGGGILSSSCEVEMDSTNLCNIYLNFAGNGTDVYLGGPNASINLVVDTFSVTNPTPYYFYIRLYNTQPHPIQNPTYSIQNGKISLVSNDLYVSPQGCDTNSGTSPDNALRTITWALLSIESDSANPHTINVVSGEYSTLSGEKLPLGIKSHVNVLGQSTDSCVVDGMYKSGLLIGGPGTKNYSLKNLTFRKGKNLRIYLNFGGMYIDHNYSATYENLVFDSIISRLSGLNIEYSNQITFNNCIIKNHQGDRALRTDLGSENYGFYDTVRFLGCSFYNNRDYNIYDECFGGAVNCFGGSCKTSCSAVYFDNCLFYDNYIKPDVSGGWSPNSIGVGFGASVYITNCTFADNVADNPNGGNIGVTYNSDLRIYNSIMYNNHPRELYMYFDGNGDNSLELNNCIVEGGEAGIESVNPSGNIIDYGAQNLNTDPLFDNQHPFHPYSISVNSPCINTGTQNLPETVKIGDIDIIGNPRVWNSEIDMGAYEYGPWVGSMSHTIALRFKAYPNPFNSHTSMTFTLESPIPSEITVFDIKGNKVRTLYTVTITPETQTAKWDGKDDRGSNLPPGLYIIVLGNAFETSKGLRVVKL